MPGLPLNLPVQVALYSVNQLWTAIAGIQFVGTQQYKSRTEPEPFPVPFASVSASRFHVLAFPGEDLSNRSPRLVSVVVIGMP